MATTTVSDYVIWTKHIHGDAGLADDIARLAAGETIDLRIDNVGGTWRKMDDGRDGRPTSGLRPLGRTSTFWNGLYKSRRGDVVSLERLEPGVDGFREVEAPAYTSAGSAAASDVAKFMRSDADRRAALNALLDGAKGGWRSDGETMTRDEMHDR
jgi:hypothetical protein